MDGNCRCDAGTAHKAGDEPLAAAQLAADGWYSSGGENMLHVVWNGTIYKDDGPNEWLYTTDGLPFYRVIVTDTTGGIWPLRYRWGKIRLLK